MDGILRSSSPCVKQRLSSFSPSQSLSPVDNNTISPSSSLFQTQTHLSSFTISPLKLAEAGFEYLPTTGNAKDAVICKQCKLVYYDWEEDESPMKVHLTLKPDCPFLKECNERESHSPVISSPTSLNDGSLNSMSSETPENHIDHLSRIRRQLFPSTATDSDNFTLDVPVPFVPKDGNKLMLFESHRKLTFEKPYSLEAAKFAAAGFKFSENYGCAVCVFCNLELEFFPVESDTHLDMLHEEKSPTCPFTRGYDVCNISDDCERRIKEKFYWENNQARQTIVTYPVKHLEFEKMEARFGTFKTWPKIVSSEFPPEKMAECGFFYSGGSDCVRCYCCGVGLFNWVKKSDPFTQHARASPQCMFLLQMKGNDFVRDAQDEELMVRVKLEQSESSEAESSLPSSTSSSLISSPTSSPSSLPSSPVGTPCLDMDTIKKALACGYSQKDIAAAVGKFFLSTCGQLYPNDKLLEGYLKAGNDNHKQVCEQREEIMKKDTELIAKETVIEAKDSVIQAKDSQLQAKDSQLQAKDSVIQAKDRELALTKQNLLCPDVQERSVLVQQIEQQNEMLHQNIETILQKDETIHQKDETIHQKDEELEQKVEELEHNAIELDLKDKQIEVLQSHVFALMEELKRKDPTYLWNGGTCDSNANDENFPVAKCLICLSKPSRIAFFPCGHLCCCDSCATRLQGDNCPVCRGPKNRYEFVFVN